MGREGVGRRAQGATRAPLTSLAFCILMRPLSSHFTFHFLSSTSSVSNVLIIGARKEILLLEKSSRIWSSRFVVPFCFFFFFFLSPPLWLFQPFLFEQTRLNLCEVMRMKCFEFNYIGEFYICFLFSWATLVTEFFYMSDILRFDFSNLRDREIVTRCITRE